MIDTATLNAWVQSVQGKYINMDGAHGAQCWDLSAHWAQWIGKPIINTGGRGRWPGWAGNMVDAFPQTPGIAADYDLIPPDQKGEPGDHVVWGDSYWYYPATHVAVLIADKGGMLTCMSQNSTPSRADNPYPGASSGPTTIQSLPRQGLIGFIRPRTGIQLLGDTTAETTTPKEWDEMATEEQLRKIFRSEVDASLVTMLDPSKDRRAGDGISWSVWKDRDIPGFNGDVPAGVRLAGIDQAVNDNRALLAAQNGMLAGLVGALAAVSKGEPFDEAKLLAGVQSAAEAGVKNAIESITVTIKEG